MAEWGYEHRLTVRFHHVVHIPFKLSRTLTLFKFSQASTSSSVLTTLDICHHDAKSFVRITESQKLWIGFFPDHDALDEKRNSSMRFQFVSQPDIYNGSVRWVITSAVFRNRSTQQELHMPKFLYDQSTTLDDSCFSTLCPTGPHASIQDLSCHTINSTSGCMCLMNMVSCMQNDSADFLE